MRIIIILRLSDNYKFKDHVLVVTMRTSQSAIHAGVIQNYTSLLKKTILIQEDQSDLQSLPCFERKSHEIKRSNHWGI